jgi:hypothetical protein
MNADLGNLAAAIAAAGIDPTGMVVVAATRQALTLKLFAGPRFDYPIIATTALPDRSVAAFAPGAVAAAFAGEPDIETSRDVALHFEDTTPAAIGTPGTPAVVAAPVRSAFQEDVIAIRCRALVSWCVAAPGAAQIVNNANW